MTHFPSSVIPTSPLKLFWDTPWRQWGRSWGEQVSSDRTSDEIIALSQGKSPLGREKGLFLTARRGWDTWILMMDQACPFKHPSSKSQVPTISQWGPSLWHRSTVRLCISFPLYVCLPAACSLARHVLPCLPCRRRRQEAFKSSHRGPQAFTACFKWAISFPEPVIPFCKSSNAVKRRPL